MNWALAGGLAAGVLILSGAAACAPRDARIDELRTVCAPGKVAALDDRVVVCDDGVLHLESTDG